MTEKQKHYICKGVLFCDIMMRLIAPFYLLLCLIFTSCKDDSALHQAEITRALKEKELVFANINKAWNFNTRTLTPESQSIATNWNEWRLFTNELYQKPKSTISAFKQKTKSLAQKAEVLNTSIPTKLQKPQIKSRLMAIVTKVKALNTFMAFDRIPEKKVLTLVTDLNIEVNAFQDQIEEIVRRSHIQFEEGELEMLNSIRGGANPLESQQDSIKTVSPPTQGTPQTNFKKEITVQ
ncbi:hypothetical protein [Flavobacterium terrae]|uniref:Uncharacterized protein n=1 Tax=Flavobacterium terrae TaxID=415425 RepID=A0A1M6AMD7_9FLAO|nr:hypothetical protein [Flavobacterium terrae]SHI37567.1 hypothetical protein SAMN05444363_0291 [Flavobacterium terrae]